MKACKKCGVEKSLDEFYNDKARADGKKTRCKSCLNEQKQTYYTENREAVKAHVVAYQKANRERINQRVSEFRKEHPEFEQNKAAKRRGYKGQSRLPRGYWKAMLAFYGECCAKCGNSDSLTFDHVQPLALAGEHSLRNGQILCHSCNSAKRDRNNEDYRGAEILVGIQNGLVVTETRLNKNKKEAVTSGN